MIIKKIAVRNQINIVIDHFNKKMGKGSILGLKCEGCRVKKGLGILLGIQYKISDWQEANREAMY